MTDLDEEVRELLKRRAERAAATVREHDEGAIVWLAEFPVGQERCALPLASLRACIPLRAVTPVPLSPPQVIGILRWEGQIITALSLASLLGARGWRDDPAILLVVEAGPDRLVAVDCEQVPKAMALPAESIERARHGASGALTRVATPALDEVLLVDLAQLLTRMSAEAGDGA